MLGSSFLQCWKNASKCSETKSILTRLWMYSFWRISSICKNSRVLLSTGSPKTDRCSLLTQNSERKWWTILIYSWPCTKIFANRWLVLTTCRLPLCPRSPLCQARMDACGHVFVAPLFLVNSVHGVDIINKNFLKTKNNASLKD